IGRPKEGNSLIVDGDFFFSPVEPAECKTLVDERLCNLLKQRRLIGRPEAGDDFVERRECFVVPAASLKIEAPVQDQAGVLECFWCWSRSHLRFRTAKFLTRSMPDDRQVDRWSDSTGGDVVVDS